MDFVPVLGIVPFQLRVPFSYGNLHKGMANGFALLSSAWFRDWQVFDLLPAFFYEAYHKRSSVESTNSSLKTLFPGEFGSEKL